MYDAFDPPLLVPTRPPPEEERVAAVAALTRLAALRKARLSEERDAELTRLLDPLRAYPAVGVRCPKCNRGLGFIALEEAGTGVASGNGRQPPKRRLGGVRDLADLTEPHPARAFKGWQEDARAGRGPVRPSDIRSHEARRRTYECLCRQVFTATNPRLLQQLLEAVRKQKTEVWL
jgi:hypothetical protein